MMFDGMDEPFAAVKVACMAAFMAFSIEGVICLNDQENRYRQKRRPVYKQNTDRFCRHFIGNYRAYDRLQGI